MKTIFILHFLFLLTTSILAEDQRTEKFTYSNYISSERRYCIYHKKEIPNIVGIISRRIINIPGTIIFSPAGIYPFLIEGELKGFVQNAYGLSDYTLGRGGYIILGAPFYFLELTFWDVPICLYETIFYQDDPKEEKNDGEEHLRSDESSRPEP